jgi:hypothetical protein
MNKSEFLENKLLLDQIQNKTNESNKKYYKDVLDFLNMLFETEENSILKIKVKKISINENIIKTYNYIVKKHKLKKSLVNEELFDFDTEYDQDDVFKVSIIMSNNLLEKLNYKINVGTYNKKKYVSIKSITT